MKKTMQKTISTILVVLMFLTLAPLQGFVDFDWNLLDFCVKASAATEGYYTYTVSNGKATIIYVDTSISGDITIPSILDGYSVITIGNEAFYDCSSLTSVTIPDSVTTIGEYAFHYCSSLTSVTIPGSVTTIGGAAFYRCSSLASVTIPDSVTTIGNGAFQDCSSLTSVTIPDSVTTIGGNAFQDCSSLTSVTIPDSVTTIGICAFYGCSSLTSVTIPDSVTTICNGVFYDCSSLTSVTIPDSVTTIGDYVFYDCSSLTSVTIPDSVTTIGEYAFCWCSSLTSVTIPDSVTTIGGRAFLFCGSLTNVYYNGTEEQWKKISIGSFNEKLTSATIHFSQDTESGDANSDGYKLRLRSDGAYSDSIAVGETISFWTFLYKGKERLGCERAYAISFDTPGIFEVTKTKKTSTSFDVTLKACKAGTTNMTVSDSETGAYVTISLKANNPIEVTTMDEVKNLAKEYQEGRLTHFYDYNGLYVDGYSYRKNNDGSYNVSMNVYNEKAHHGAVVSYDKDGNIVDYELIDPQDKLPTSLWDGLFDSFDLVNAQLEKLTDKYLYDETALTKKTRIDDLNVPDGGYFVISNNYLENEYVFFANSINVAIDLICAYSKVNKIDVPDELPEKATEKVLEKIFKDLGPDQIKTVFKKLVKNFAKDLTISNVDVFMSGLVSTFDEFEINIEEIIKDTLEDLMTDTEAHLDFAEDIVLTLFGADAIKTALSSLGYINTGIKLIDVFSSSLAPEIVVYTPAEKDTVRISNGVTVTSETPLASDYVLHTYVINEQDDVMTQAKPTIESMTSNYKMYDITLYKSSQAAQPNSKITVMIPIPANYNKSKIQIYWYKDDGTLQPMNATVKGDYAVFETDHLSYYVLIETHNHEYEIISTVDADCAKKGSITYSCNCGNTYTEEISIDKNAHSWDNGTITITATCKVSGMKTYTCQHNASHKKTENLGFNVSNHVNTKNVAEVKSTCTTKGYTAGVYCNDCQKYISGHTEIPVDTNAHKWDNGTVTTTATCKVSGEKTYTCQHNSAHKKTESLGVNASNHVNTKNVAELKATCTTKGYTAGVYCNDCQKYISGHTEIGIDVNAHKWDNGSITTTATCKVSGVKTYTCQHNSSHKKTENLGINASNHVNTKNVAEVKATCTTKGYTAGVYCNDCQKYISGHKEIAVNTTNHVNTKKVPETPATFENIGYTAGVYCNDCKKYISGHVEIPKLVPEFTDSKDAKESGNNIVSNNGLTVAQLLSQAGKGAVIKTAGGKSVENAALIGTGMILTMADGSKKEIVVYGDVDGDGKISAADARQALRASVGLENFKEDSSKYKAAKRGSLDKLSAADARLILRASVGLEDPKSWLK